MDRQLSIDYSSLSFAPRGNLGQDFIDIVAHVKGASIWQQFAHMKLRNAQTIVNMNFGN
jgi:hypothetical protein